MIFCFHESRKPILVAGRGIFILPSYRWVEMMAPVFSSAAWRCAWHMIQVCQFFMLLLFDNFIIEPLNI